ncbi:MAG TPA: flagellar basal body rod protein FlgB [Stellaceae bacterium]|nr:flagellar basal body rod protein FlgB [Stellaceae bacterium]
MDLSNIPLFKAMAKKLNWLGGRQAVLAENVANANTPDFRPSDVKSIDFQALLSGSKLGGTLKLVTTAPNQIATPPSAIGGVDRVQQPGRVDLEDQMIKVSQTATDYAFTTNLYQKQITLIKHAIDQNGGG